MFNGRRQPSRGGTSRMMREYQVRICERLGVKFPGPTRHQRRYGCPGQPLACPLYSDRDDQLRGVWLVEKWPSSSSTRSRSGTKDHL